MKLTMFVDGLLGFKGELVRSVSKKKAEKRLIADEVDRELNAFRNEKAIKGLELKIESLERMENKHVSLSDTQVYELECYVKLLNLLYHKSAYEVALDVDNGLSKMLTIRDQHKFTYLGYKDAMMNYLTICRKEGLYL